MLADISPRSLSAQGMTSFGVNFLLNIIDYLFDDRGFVMTDEEKTGEGVLVYAMAVKHITAGGLAAMLFLPMTTGLAEDTAGGAGHAVISLEDCKRLVRHRPRADVSYAPGVDVRGKPVAPAELEGAAHLAPPTEITIDFGFDLAGRHGVPGGGPYEAKAGVGKVRYDLSSGALTFNGQRLNEGDSQAAIAACERALSGHPIEK
ncbi:MAG: hypothetical protein HQL35_02550 [Alphaproteobacteria bacterium]|nr:hypothetical protein [Alphaproteobacteria bacterium]